MNPNVKATYIGLLKYRGSWKLERKRRAVNNANEYIFSVKPSSAYAVYRHHHNYKSIENELILIVLL